jgi:toluene monooxygenase system protein B
VSDTTIDSTDAAQPTDAAQEPYLIPLNGVFATDFVELLIPVMSNQTVAELAEAVAAHSEGIRVPAQDRPKVVYHEGRAVPSELTVAEAEIRPLDRVTVDYAN